MKAAPVILLFAALLAAVSAQATVSPGFWTNQTVEFLGPQKSQEYPFTFTYDTIPSGEQYHFELDIQFAEWTDDYSLQINSVPLAELVVKEKAILGVVMLHCSQNGDQNGWIASGLQCGVLSGTVRSPVPVKTVTSALFLESFTSPNQCKGGIIIPLPPTVVSETDREDYLPPILAALISFFATIGAFLLLIFCCCLCCRFLCGRRLGKCCRSQKKCETAYPAQQETEMEQGQHATEYAPVETAAAAPYPYVFPVFQTMVNGQPQYVMMYPQVQPPTSV